MTAFPFRRPGTAARPVPGLRVPPVPGRLPAVTRWLRTHTAQLAVFGGTAGVAVCAFLYSFSGTTATARHGGTSSPQYLPLVIEGGVIVSGVCSIWLPKGQRRLAWGILCALTAVSCGTNLMNAVEHRGGTLPGRRDWIGWGNLVVALVPPLILPFCVRLAEKVALRSRRLASRTTVPVPVPARRPAAATSRPSRRSGTTAAVPGGTVFCAGPCGKPLSRSKLAEHRQIGCPGHRYAKEATA